MLNIIVALKCEAKPIINYYGLKRLSGQHAFPVYENNDIVLTISGWGKIAAAAATSFVHVFKGMRSHSAWLNIGIAGHCGRAIGQGVLAHKISDAATGKNWYPPMIIDVPCELENLLTVDKVEENFHENAVYEMEAAGFYETASRFSTAELIHCYKVISDNKLSSVSGISADVVTKLVENKMQDIEIILSGMKKLSDELCAIDSIPGHYQEICDRWHFSVYQKGELQRLLKRREVLGKNEETEENNLISRLAACKNSKGVLSSLKHDLDAVSIGFNR